ncbi:MAG: hypothetical protein VX278_21230 [Myxococcota bacterium]|nr:hypothetical protein [Myxococcota bacterium]
MTWFLFITACAPKKVVVEKPKIEWVQEDGSSAACYYAPAFETLDSLDRKEAQSKALDAIVSQWKGERNDGVKIKEELIDGVETVLLGDMLKVEVAVKENLSYCKQYASNASSLPQWQSWVSNLPAQLTEGECDHHFRDTVLDYVEVDTEWMPASPLRICKGDKIRISAAPKDRYRIEEEGPWITVQGDSNIPTAGSESYPCKVEGCFAGMVVLRFKSEDVEEVVPVGAQATYTAPADGVIFYGINDDTFYNNKWYMSNGLIEHASITVEPAK